MRRGISYTWTPKEIKPIKPITGIEFRILKLGVPLRARRSTKVVRVGCPPSPDLDPAHFSHFYRPIMGHGA